MTTLTNINNHSAKPRVKHTQKNGMLSKSTSIPSTQNASNQTQEGVGYHERSFLPPQEQTFPFFYTKHSLSTLAMIIVVMYWFAIMHPTQEIIITFTADDIPDTAKTILKCCLFFYLLIGSLVFPSGPFIRPHPLIWRIIFSISLLYAFLLIILLILHPTDARALLKIFDPSLGKPIELPLYAENCALTWTNVISKLDRFVLAHFFGWFAKGLLIRHRIILWSMSILWELVELSTFYYIPNFAECWWDQWLLDVLICNGAGIELGLLACTYLQQRKDQFRLRIRRYEFSELVTTENIYKKWCKISTKMFQPASWTTVQWESSKNIQRFIQVLFIVLCQCLAEMNAFLLKLYLWIPTQHWWNLARLIFIYAMTLPAVRQYYYYITDTKLKYLGSQLYVLLLIITLETMLCYKTAPDNIPVAPFENKTGWTIGTLVFLFFTFLITRKFEEEPKQHHVD